MLLEELYDAENQPLMFQLVKDKLDDGERVVFLDDFHLGPIGRFVWIKNRRGEWSALLTYKVEDSTTHKGLISYSKTVPISAAQLDDEDVTLRRSEDDSEWEFALQ